MYIELFTVSGQSGDLESALKKTVEDLRNKVERPDRVRLATVKIRPDAAEQVLRLVSEPLEKVPPHYRSLVNMLKKYNISQFPAVIIDGVKIGEGTVDIEEAVGAVLRRAKSEFPELAELEVAPLPTAKPVETKPLVEPTTLPPPPTPSPAPKPMPLVEPTTLTPPPTPPPPSLTPPPTPPPAQKPVSLIEQPTTLTPPPIVKPVTTEVKFVLGRPDDCNVCAYFGVMTSRCFLFGFAVVNSASPPCKNVRGGG